MTRTTGADASSGRLAAHSDGTRWASVASGQRRDGLAHAAQAFADELGARRVRQPDVTIGSEVSARNDRDTRVLEQEAGDVARARERRCAGGSSPKEPRHVGERVER